MSSSEINSSDQLKRQGDDNFKAIQYNQMMDDSKQTEEADISKSDFTETQSQETLRNLHKSGQKDNIDLKKVNMIHEYENLPEDEESQRTIQLQLENHLSNRIYTQEEDKSHDIINKSKELENEEEYGDEEEQKQHRRVHTDGNFDCYDNHEQSKYDKRKTVNKFTTISMKPHLPQLKLNVPLVLSSSQIFEIFANVSKNQRFQVIEMEQSIATAVNKEPFSLKRMFLRCIPFQDFKKEQPTESFISAVRLQLSVNEIKCCRKITLKGLYGDNSRLQDFVQSFKSQIHVHVANLPESKQRSKNSPNSKQSLQKQPKKKNSNKFQTTLGNNKFYNNASDDDSEGEMKHGTYTETSSLYQIHKILSSDQYTLGKNIAEYIESFHLQYKSLRESSELLPQPVNLHFLKKLQTEGIMAIVNEIVHTFHSEYNLGKESAKSLMHYCRPSVEKYIFSKLYDKLFAMYAIKNEKEDRLFVEKSGLIKRVKAHEVMAFLGINEKFIICEHLNFTSRTSFVAMDQSKYASISRESLPFKQIQDADTSNNFDTLRSEATPIGNQNEQSIFNNSSTSSSLNLPVFINKSDLPYIEAIKCIEKIQQYTSPREKLQCISESFGCMKTAIVDYWKGKVELNAMDDVLPLTIYAVAMSELSHPASEINILEDYLRIHDKGFELERKLLTNLDVSVRYINHEWQFSKQ